MVHYRIGCVPYANAFPYILWFDQNPWLPFTLTKAPPAELANLLEKRQIDLMLASSYVALSEPGLKIAEGVSISSFGEVASVKIFSNVPLSDIQTLFFDPSSLTSNRLAQLILIERYQCSPKIINIEGSLEDKLCYRDAAVLIGDPCIEYSSRCSARYTADLGKEWTEMTNLPFVWALWMGQQYLDKKLVGWLNEARRWSLDHLDLVLEKAAKERGWTREFATRYYTQHINYELTEKHIEGLKLYQRLLIKHKFLTRDIFPELVNEEGIIESRMGM